MKITAMRWQWVEAFRIYRVIYTLNNHYEHMIFIEEKEVRWLDKTVPEAVVYWLRTPLDCDPVEEVWR